MKQSFRDKVEDRFQKFLVWLYELKSPWYRRAMVILLTVPVMVAGIFWGIFGLVGIWYSEFWNGEKKQEPWEEF